MSSKRKWDQAAPEEVKDDPESPAKVAKVDESKNASTAAAAAAAIAAKIAAQYSGAAAGGGGGLLGPKDIHDGEFTQDIDINDVRNRYMLTKGSTQQQVRHSNPSMTEISHKNSCLFSSRYTTKRVPRSARKVSGTPIARRPQRKTLLCTFTYPRIRRKYYKMLLTKSTNSLQSTWALSSRIREGAKKCISFSVVRCCSRCSRLLSVNGLRRRFSSAWSQSVISTYAPRLSALQ